MVHNYSKRSRRNLSLGTTKMNKLSTKERLYCLIGLIFPMMLGLFIYLTSGKSTYISNVAQLPTINYPVFIINYLCDFLWAFALCCGLRLIGNPLKECFIISTTSSIIIEVSQIFLSFGTFDVIDILVEVAAIVLVVISIRMITKRGTYLYE